MYSQHPSAPHFPGHPSSLNHGRASFFDHSQTQLDLIANNTRNSSQQDDQDNQDMDEEIEVDGKIKILIILD